MDSEDGRTQISNRTSPAGRAPFHSQIPQYHPVPGSRSPATASAIGLLGLPTEIRRDIFRRVLVVSHPIYLFQDKGSRVETFAPERPVRWLALLYTNQQVCCEASAVLYGMNHFVLVDATQQQVGLLQSFLSCIGPANADSLSHLSINFPAAESVEDQPGEVKIREDGLQSLRLLQEKCTNLTTLEAFVHGKNSGFLTQTDEDSSQFVREALLRIDSQLKAISSLNKIIVRVYIGTLTPSVMDLMQQLGWVVSFSNQLM